MALRCLNVEKDNDYFYHEVFSQEGGILLYLMFVLLKGIFICSSCLFLSDSFGGIEWAKGYHLQYLWLEIVVFTFIYWVFYVVDKPHSFFSKIYSVLSFIFFVIPCNSYLGLSNCGIYFWIYAHLYVILFLLATRILDRIAYPTFVVGREKAVIKSDNLKVLTYTISCAFFLYAFLLDRFTVHIFEFDYVYVHRLEFLALSQQLAGSAIYYLHLFLFEVSKILLLFCTYYALKSFHVMRVLACLVSFFSIFSLGMDKAYVVLLCVVVAVILVEKIGFKHVTYALLGGSLVIVASTFAEYWIFGSNRLFTVIVERSMYLTWFMEDIWFQFWTINDNLWFRQDFVGFSTIFNALDSLPYHDSATHIIAEKVFDFIIPEPNSGFISEAVAHMNVFGIIIFPLLHASYLKVADSIVCCFGLAGRLIFAIFLVMTLISAQIFMLHYVLLLLMLVVSRYLLLSRARKITVN